MIKSIKQNWRSQDKNNRSLGHLLCTPVTFFRGQSLLNFCLAVSSGPYLHASRQYTYTIISFIFFNFYILFIWLHCVSFAAHRCLVASETLWCNARALDHRRYGSILQRQPLTVCKFSFPVACEILVPLPGIQPQPLHWKAHSKHWTSREIPFFKFIYFNWRLITYNIVVVFCHTLTWISHWFTCVHHCFI